MKWLGPALLLLFLYLYLHRRFLALAGPRPVRREEPQRADPYVILGVAHHASSEEITQAYREQMKLYHPDRVADLGEELQKLAHEKTVAIQRAYEELAPR